MDSCWLASIEAHLAPPLQIQNTALRFKSMHHGFQNGGIALVTFEFPELRHLVTDRSNGRCLPGYLPFKFCVDRQSRLIVAGSFLQDRIFLCLLLFGSNESLTLGTQH